MAWNYRSFFIVPICYFEPSLWFITHWPLLKFERGPSVGQKYHSKTQSMLINIAMLPFVVELFSSVWILLEESLWYTDHPLLPSICVETFLICPPSWTSAHPWGYTGYPLCLWLWTLWLFEWVYTCMYTSMRNPWATLDWPPITLAMRRRHLGEALAGESLTYPDDVMIIRDISNRMTSHVMRRRRMGIMTFDDLDDAGMSHKCTANVDQAWGRPQRLKSTHSFHLNDE